MSKIQSGCGFDSMNCNVSHCPDRTTNEENLEVLELDDMVSDTVPITADDIAAINDAVTRSEEVKEESNND